MFSHFLNLFDTSKKWRLKPFKYPKDSENSFSSKALLPYFILGDLVAYDIQPPYIFQIYRPGDVFKTACSVLDFQLDTEDIHIPGWMFEQLALDSSSSVFIEPITPVKGTGIKLLPHSVDFLSIEYPKKELELGLKNYHVLSVGDEILLNFEDIGRCRFTVTRIYPEIADSIYIVDTDLNVDFDEPLGYKEKLESERSVLKYINKVEKNNVQVLEFDKNILFFDWNVFSTNK